MSLASVRQSVRKRAELYHGRTPGVRKMPLPAVSITIGLVFVNVLVWVAVGIVLVRAEQCRFLGFPTDLSLSSTTIRMVTLLLSP